MADLHEARARDASFVAYLCQRVGRRLCAVAEYDPDGSTVSFCRGDFELGADEDGRLPDGLRTEHRCRVTVRDGAVWLSFDRLDGYVLVVVESNPSRDLARLVADCRGALEAAHCDGSLA